MSLFSDEIVVQKIEIVTLDTLEAAGRNTFYLYSVPTLMLLV